MSKQFHWIPSKQNGKSEHATLTETALQVNNWPGGLDRSWGGGGGGGEDRSCMTVVSRPYTASVMVWYQPLMISPSVATWPRNNNNNNN